VPPKSKLGQNFLRDQQAIRRIVVALGGCSDRTVVEIGPGMGAITRELAAKAGKVLALEYDRDLASRLMGELSGSETKDGSASATSNVEIKTVDVLSFDFGAAASSANQRLIVAGNLPYYITSDILLRLFEFHEQFDVIVIMVQREVADRIAAHPGTRDYGMLSATAQLYASVENLFTLPPQAFSPPPKVHSSVLRLTVAPRFDELQVKPVEFIAFLKTAFAMKRKTLLNNLKKDYGEEIIRNSVKEAGVRADVRAEALPLETTAQIFRNLQSSKNKP